MRTAALIGLLTLAPGAAADDPPPSPQELGAVRWMHDLEDALAESKRSARPVLLLFQEIPGCQGCRDFGDEPMSHPLLVEAIETSFVPVALSNNRGGYDETVRKRYEEPAWNYPVMRFLDADGVDLLPRRDRIFTVGAVAARLAAALRAAQRPVPAYLDGLVRETAPGATAKATFAMACFWEGEAHLGALDGVVATEAAWYDGREVVQVTYDPARVAFSRLLAQAQQQRCTSHVYTHDDAQRADAVRILGNAVSSFTGALRAAKASDRTFALNRTPYRWLPLTPRQRTKVNADLRLGGTPLRHLSPRQRELLSRIEARLATDPNALAPLETRREEPLPVYAKALNAHLSALAGAKHPTK